MVGILKGLISGEELDAEYIKRREDHDLKTLPAKTEEALQAKIDAEIKDGWILKRKLKRSAVMRMQKPSDRWVEDRLWSLFKLLGFEEMNKDRQFKIIEVAGTKRQVDIFAKDGETVFVVECTHLKQPGPRSMKTVIDKINAYKHDVITAIHQHYGKEPRLKVKFAIGTDNIIWNKEDIERAKAGKIAVITEADVAYYNDLYKVLKGSARFNFLGRYLKGEKVEGLQLILPATRGKAGGKIFYNFLISPHRLLRVGYINHRQNNTNDDINTYQRMVKSSRLDEIAQFINDGGVFPSNIIINFKAGSELHFQSQHSFGDTATGLLSIPALFGSAWIIDGQHRLYGYANSKLKEDKDHTVVSVLAYENLPIKGEVRMFIDINTKQVKIRRTLVDEVVASLDVNDDNPVRRLEALYAQLPMRLVKDATGPLHDRITITGNEKSTTCCISTASLSDQCESANLIGRAQKASKGKPASLELGPLADPSNDSQAILAKASKTLTLYFDLFAKAMPDHWSVGDGKGGYLCTNNGLRPLIQLLAKLIDFVEKKECVTARNMDAAEIIDRVKPYIEPLISYFMTADPQLIQAFRNRGSSLKTVDDNCSQMMIIISEANSSFTTKELEAFKSLRDVKGTQQAKEMIAEINTIIFEDVIASLQNAYGTDEKDWWIQGVPPTIRNKCDQQYNQSSGKSDRWSYLSFSNYPDILLYAKNWDHFKAYYNLEGKRKRSDAVSWMGRINKAKAVTDHAERGPLSPEDVEFVKSIHALVLRHVRDEVEVDHKVAIVPGGSPTIQLEAVA